MQAKAASVDGQGATVPCAGTGPWDCIHTSIPAVELAGKG